MTLRSRLVAFMLVAASAASLAGCAATTEGSGSTPSAEASGSAADVLTSYLTAISEGRASDALALVEHAGQSDAALLTDDVLKSATERITDISVDSDGSTLTEDGGTLAYSYSLGGETFQGNAPLFHASDGMWKVDGLPGDGSILGTLNVTANPAALIESATFGKTDIPLNTPQLVFPAIYEPDVVAIDGFTVAEHDPKKVTGDDQTGYMVTFQPDDTAVAKAVAVANDLVTECAAQPNAAPEVGGSPCPFGMTVAYSGTWSNLPAATCEWMDNAADAMTAKTERQLDWLNENPTAFACEVSLADVSFTTVGAFSGDTTYTGYGTGQFAIQQRLILVSAPDFALIR